MSYYELWTLLLIGCIISGEASPQRTISYLSKGDLADITSKPSQLSKPHNFVILHKDFSYNSFSCVPSLVKQMARVWTMLCVCLQVLELIKLVSFPTSMKEDTMDQGQCQGCYYGVVFLVGVLGDQESIKAVVPNLLVTRDQFRGRYLFRGLGSGCG